MKRKTFLKTALATAGGVALVSPFIISKTKDDEIFAPEEITEFVFAAHKDFDKTKKLIEAKPLLLNCTNQLKKGDFETALGGASHMGRRDIADLLVSKGARMDIFNQAFLGLNDVVIQTIEAYPHLLKSPGPHGFSLLHHAKAGKNQNLMDWLQEKGLTETHIKGVF